MEQKVTVYCPVCGAVESVEHSSFDVASCYVEYVEGVSGGMIAVSGGTNACTAECLERPTEEEPPETKGND